MKTTCNFLLSLLLLVGAVGVTGAQAQPPKKLAVLVVGMGSDAKGDDFAARLGSDLNRDNEYDLQTKANNIAVAAKLDDLRAAHTPATPVDTTGLAAWGKSNGIDLVQLVVESTTTGTAVVTAKINRVAHLVDCETGMLFGRGLYRMSYATKEMVASTGLPMVRVTGGVFEMGCKSGRDGSCNSNELPLHWVKVNDFSIGKYPITQKQWIEVMGRLPTNFTTSYYVGIGDNRPVVSVTFNEIVDKDGFLDKLNALTGLNYRLPTEAEWEYAARGCSSGECESLEFSGSNTIGDVAVYNTITTQPVVGTKKPNRLDIYDMSGNVWEWCYDWYGAYSSSSASSPLDNPTGPTIADSYRVLRGGSWRNYAKDCRVAFRFYSAPIKFNNYDNGTYVYFGLRVVLP